MKIELAIPTLFIAILPIVAQADQTTSRSLQLSEPLSTVLHKTPAVVSIDTAGDLADPGASAAMSTVRTRLEGQLALESGVATIENKLQLPCPPSEQNWMLDGNHTKEMSRQWRVNCNSIVIFHETRWH